MKKLNIRHIKKFISDHFFNKYFYDNYKKYIYQSFLIFVSLSIILFLGKFFDGIIVASLGASCFILFAVPQKGNLRIKYVIGGYFWGLFLGVPFNFLYYMVNSFDFFEKELVMIVICAIAAAFTSFFMLSTKLEHPPAVAVTIGLVVEPEPYKAATAIAAGVIMLCAVRRLLKDCPEK